MKLNWKREILPLVLFATMLVAAVYWYPLLPNIVPSHFDLRGRPNGWMTKQVFFLASFLPFLLMYVILTFLPSIDPLKRKIEPKFKVVLLFRDFILVFLALLFLVSLKASYDKALSVNLFGILFGLLFVALGNYMPKAPQNWFVGIRSPWALSSEIVWKKTHILGGWLLMLAGIAFAVCAVLKTKPWIGICALLVSVMVPYVYSFFLFKQLERSGDLQRPNL